MKVIPPLFAVNVELLDKLKSFTIIIIGIITCILLLAILKRRKNAGVHSHRQEDNLLRILDDFNITMWSWEPGSKNFFVSSGIKHLTGGKAIDLKKNPLFWQKFVHPYDALRVREAVNELLAGKKTMLEHRILLADGRVRWINNLAVPVKDNAGKIKRLEGLIIDINDQKVTEESMKQMAFYDALTGLPNRTMFANYFSHCQASSLHFSQKLAILFIDLDSFKAVNDTLGHDTGDLLLIAVATRLKALLRGSDLLSRIGGDEFVALLTRVSEESIQGIAPRIIEAFSEPFPAGQHRLVMGASIGISIYPDDGKDLETLMHNADQAMYQAKRQGKNNFCFYRSIPEEK
ncbi:MAG: sensor domain-containing diguanylate cyclase [Syntrophomonas sp.]